MSRVAVITVAMLAGMFLAAIDTTAVSTAMPAIVGSLGGLHLYAWVFSIYMLTSTATMPLFGYLSDVVGRKALYLTGIALFLAGSVLCSTATSMPMLIVYRGVQGLGAGAVIPLTMTIIGELYDLEQRARMQGLFSGVWGISAIVGPLIGGGLVDTWSWRAIFYLNVPFGLVAAALVIGFLDEPRRVRQHPCLNIGALLSLTAGTTIFIVGIQEAGRGYAWTSPRVAGGILAGALVLTLFSVLDRRSRSPILPAALLRDRLFSACAWSGFCAGAALFGLVAYLPLYVQLVRGGSATAAGSSLLPITLGWFVSSIIAGRLLLRIGYRWVVLPGLAALVVGTLGLSQITGTTSLAYLAVALVTCGVGFGLSMTTMLIAVQNGVPGRLLGTATAAVPFTRNIGGAIGVAIMGVLLVRRLGGADIDQLIVAGATADLEASIRIAMFTGTLFAAAALVAALRLPGGSAHELAHEERAAKRSRGASTGAG